jgi:prepilin-type N-terminal cleavage/methylation domain-containing protein
MRNCYAPVFRIGPQAFTLIELLIVVAIIAILAAIAVPNFLEAQTRSKVARAKADMRTCVLGVSAYTVDFNKQPPVRFPGTFANGKDGVWHHGFVPAVLTTPIAYLGTIPLDPFTKSKTSLYGASMPSIWTQLTGESRSDVPYFEFRKIVWVGIGADSGKEYSALELPSDVPRWGGDAYERLKSEPFFMRSPGPDEVWDHSGALDPAQPSKTLWVISYDPTNGTISRGDLFQSPGGGK